METGRADAGGDASSAARAPAAIRAGCWCRSLRHLGFAARFVSGYLIQLKPDLVALDGPPGTDHDFTDLHAWCEVYLPGAGWIGLDPTSGLLTGESHIPLAATPHYRNAAPISGVASFANVDFDFDMRVAPRRRASAHHQAVLRRGLGRRSTRSASKVDASLAAGDVRLTMGGEPTFVSIDDFEAGEWNTAAVGPTKRELADELIRRLRDRFAPGGFLHYGQGKWYPGESLPRWTFSLYWRRDGKPIWQRPDADRRGGRRDRAPARTRPSSCCRRIADRARRRADDGDAGLRGPGRMDAQGRQPARQCRRRRTRSSRIPEERSRIARVFERGLTKPSGYVLPVQRWQAQADGPALALGEVEDAAAASCSWCPATARSATACRWARCPMCRRRSYPYIVPVDPTVPRGPLPPHADDRCASRRPQPAQRTQAEASFTAADRRSRIASSRSSARSAAPCAPRSRSSRATAGSASSCRRSSGSRIISTSSPRPRAAAEGDRPAGAHRRLRAAARPAPQRHPRRARSRRHRGQHPSRRRLGGLRRHHRRRLRGGAAVAASAPTSS